MKAYIDRGQRPDADGIMSIGCSVFQPTPYKQFVRRWKTHLRELSDVPFIHATDFYGGWDIYRSIDTDLRNHVAAKLPATIRAYARAQTVVSFKADEFEAVAGTVWKARFGSLYTTAVQLAMGAIGHWADRNNFNGKISYFYESGDQEEPELAARLSALRPDVKKHIRMLTHAPMPKGSARGLEVADVLSWQWNKFYAETIARDGMPNERRPRKDFTALFGGESSPSLPRVFLYTGEELEYALKSLWNPSLPYRPELNRRSVQQRILAQVLGHDYNDRVGTW